MTIQEALEKLQGYEKATFALNHATGLMYYDGATIASGGHPAGHRDLHLL